MRSVGDYRREFFAADQGVFEHPLEDASYVREFGLSLSAMQSSREAQPVGLGRCAGVSAKRSAPTPGAFSPQNLGRGPDDGHFVSAGFERRPRHGRHAPGCGTWQKASSQSRGASVAQSSGQGIDLGIDMSADPVDVCPLEDASTARHHGVGGSPCWGSTGSPRRGMRS